jgi:hypothetical protein
MTLGKIERFWKTIWEEFLERAQFDSFESAGERIRLWVKHYNHRRPHQALDGLCPADRFFGIAQELRQVIERGIQENILELALRGEPQSPFYMVGRMGEQSVVIRAEKGRVKMLVDGEEDQAISYDLAGGPHGRGSREEGAAPVHGPAASAGGAGGLPELVRRGALEEARLRGIPLGLGTRRLEELVLVEGAAHRLPAPGQEQDAPEELADLLDPEVGMAPLQRDGLPLDCGRHLRRPGPRLPRLRL